MTDDELTPSEKKALESLPKERVPSALLEERVVRTLRRQGLLRRRERGRFIQITGWKITGAVAACLAFVVCGFGLGFWASSRPVAVQQVLVSEANGQPVAYSIQQAGTEYILALEKLAAYAHTTKAEDVQQGREVALNMLYTAADEMGRIIPRDVLARCIVHAIDTTAPNALGQVGGDSQSRLIEF